MILTPKFAVYPSAYRLGERAFAAAEKKVNQKWLVLTAAIVMVVLLGNVWSQVMMTKLEYQVAAQHEMRQQILTQQERLKLELAALKAPQRLETAARALGLTYPEMSRVVFVRDDLVK